MFTGIVEELGTITAHPHGQLAIRAPKVASGVALGDSVATNGVCLTVTRLDGEIFWVDYSSSTRAATTIEAWRVGDKLNLERALTLNARLGGHLVAGHVDGVGRIVSIREREGVHVAVALPEPLMRYLIPKGSITIDGVSLTVVGVHAGHFDLTIIPHSLKETTLQHRREGDRVNVEVDLIGKYVERLMGGTKSPGLTLEELARQGF
ncbi:MAG: ribE 2 [Cyanobacteria bacterium RYN_339]|nr:ribE 2 [Cyanobacteria bacterium RYN_339]